jgi:hypothetical protein
VVSASGEKGGAWALATGGVSAIGSGVGGRKILWAREKSEKEFRIKKIKIQRRLSGQHIGVTKTLGTTYCTHKEKTPIYSKLVHTIAT